MRAVFEEHECDISSIRGNASKRHHTKAMYFNIFIDIVACMAEEKQNHISDRKATFYVIHSNTQNIPRHTRDEINAETKKSKSLNLHECKHDAQTPRVNIDMDSNRWQTCVEKQPQSHQIM